MYSEKNLKIFSKTLQGNLSIWALEGPLGTWALKALEHAKNNLAFRHSRYLSTMALRHSKDTWALRHSGTRAFVHIRSSHPDAQAAALMIQTFRYNENSNDKSSGEFDGNHSLNLTETKQDGSDNVCDNDYTSKTYRRIIIQA